jgi:hypothetical protein
MPEAEGGTTLMFENEQRQAWEFLLAPGPQIGAHADDHEIAVELNR